MDVKEGAVDTVIETNYCTGQLDEDSAGIDSRASSTTIRYNKVVGCKGAGVRLGGHKVGREQYGVNCKVRACARRFLFLCLLVCVSGSFLLNLDDTWNMMSLTTDVPKKGSGTSEIEI